jgi:zinc transport system substrate-binding protein
VRIHDILRSLPLAAALFAAGNAVAAPAVVADIAPVHAIAARVMEGAGVPALLLPPGVSPHSYALRPSQARTLARAEVVVWAGPDLTPWLADVLASLAPDAVSARLADAPGLELLPAREAGAEDQHDGHAHDGQPVDPHFWLDPRNGAVMAEAIAQALAGADPQNAALYRRNAAAFGADMARLEAELDAMLAPVRDRPFVIYHDSLQYFEHRFGLAHAGSIARHEGEPPGAAWVAGIRDLIRTDGIACVFYEPQMPPKLLDTVIEGSGARAAGLDPIGVGIEPGPAFYSDLLREIAGALAGCLDGQ